MVFRYQNQNRNKNFWIKIPLKIGAPQARSICLSENSRIWPPSSEKSQEATSSELKTRIEIWKADLSYDQKMTDSAAEIIAAEDEAGYMKLNLILAILGLNLMN